MERTIREADWKVFRKLQEMALERFCDRVLEEIGRISADKGKSSHERYLAIYKVMEERDEELAGMFNDPARSRAFLQLARITAGRLLTDEECVLTNVPRIRDVEVLVALLVGLGATVEGRGTSTLRVRCANVTTDRPDPVLVGKLRGSVLLLGPLLARRGSARLAPPGGDFPARRTISTHLQALAAMGAVPLDEPGHALDAPWGLSGASLYLEEASVTGTETALLAAAAARIPAPLRSPPTAARHSTRRESAGASRGPPHR